MTGRYRPSERWIELTEDVSYDFYGGGTLAKGSVHLIREYDVDGSPLVILAHGIYLPVPMSSFTFTNTPKGVI
jgi:hypothetical protein